MTNPVIYCAGGTEAARFAHTYLKSKGLPVSHEPGIEVGHLLLDVPSFCENGQLRMGGSIASILSQIPRSTVIYGGNLNHPALSGYRIVDFLQDPFYLAQNAAITAECALDVALPYLGVTLSDCPVLILGWGRIGKCLARILKAIGANVTVAARKESDRAMLQALGYTAVDIVSLGKELSEFRLIYNTVPSPVLTAEQSVFCQEACVLIDLASHQGIFHENAVIARGLPGIHFPESSGKLMAETFLRHYYMEVTV